MLEKLLLGYGIDLSIGSHELRRGRSALITLAFEAMNANWSDWLFWIGGWTLAGGGAILLL